MTIMQDAANRLLEILLNDQQLLSLMAVYAVEQLRDQGYTPEDIAKATDEESEDTPCYNDYYRYCSQFQRKLLTASSALV